MSGAAATPDCADPALAPCFRSELPSTALLYGHGTGTASVAAGRRTGIAPDASIVSVVLAGTLPDRWVEALKQVIRHAFEPATPPFRTAIISISIATDPSDELTALIERMTTGVNANGDADPQGKRFLFVAMTGNDSEEPRSSQCERDGGVRLYPARIATSMSGVVSVGGLDRDNRPWSGSCRGPLVEVLAPATDILVASIYRTDTYRSTPEFYRSGTSWAAPYVAGIAARLLESNPQLTPAELETLLRSSPSFVAGLPVPVLLETPVLSGPRRRSIRH